MSMAKDLTVMYALHQRYYQENGEELVSNEWFVKMFAKSYGYDTDAKFLADVYIEDFQEDEKFYTNYEIVRLKDKIEKELAN